MWKEITLGVSFVNLCYLRVWSELLSYTAAQSYEMRLPPSPHDYLAAALNVVAWGTALGVVAVKLRGSGPKAHRAAQWLFLMALLVPLNALREVLAARLPIGQQYLKGGLLAALGPAGLTVFVAAAVAGGLFTLHRRGEAVARAARAVLLAFAAFVPVTLLQAGWKAVHYDPRPFGDAVLAERVAGTAAAPRRVVWVIFDEWDQRLSFDERPAGLTLAEMDRFRGGALAASEAYPPGPTTLESMPALITGRVVEKAEPLGADELRLTFPGGGAALDWRQVPNVFDAARGLGLDTALLGVYHPYCRVLGRSLTSCSWSEMPRPLNSSGGTLGDAMLGQTRSLFETWRLSLFGQSLSTRRKAREFPAALERAAAVAADRSYGLALIHLLTPHFPHSYDRSSGTFTLGNAPLRGYYDSLALTDMALGRLRRAMEAAGVWDPTTVLLSSDHAMRHAALLDGKSDRRVPFLLKLAEESGAYSHRRRFNTVLTGELLIAILRGEVASGHEAAAWLDRLAEPSEWPRD